MSYEEGIGLGPGPRGFVPISDDLPQPPPSSRESNPAPVTPSPAPAVQAAPPESQADQGELDRRTVEADSFHVMTKDLTEYIRTDGEEILAFSRKAAETYSLLLSEVLKAVPLLRVYVKGGGTEVWIDRDGALKKLKALRHQLRKEPPDEKFLIKEMWDKNGKSPEMLQAEISKLLGFNAQLLDNFNVFNVPEVGSKVVVYADKSHLDALITLFEDLLTPEQIVQAAVDEEARPDRLKKAKEDLARWTSATKPEEKESREAQRKLLQEEVDIQSNPYLVKLTVAQHGAFKSAYDARISLMEDMARTLAQKYANAYSKSENFYKVVCSCIDTLGHALRGYMQY